MLSFLYLIIATAIGWQITDLFITDRAGSRHNLIWVRLASSFGVGVLIITWPLYLTAYTLRVAGGIERPLGYANIIVLGFSLIMIMMVMMVMLVVVMVLFVFVVMMFVLVVLVVVIIVVIVVMLFQLGNPCCACCHLLIVKEVGVQQLVELHITIVALDDLCLLLYATHDLAYAFQFVWLDVGSLVQEDDVAELYLLNDEVFDVLFVDVLLGEVRAAIELVFQPQGIHYGDDAIDVWDAILCDFRSHSGHLANRLGDGLWLANAAGFDDDVVELLEGDDVVELLHQVHLERATDASVLKGDQAVVLTPNDATLLDEVGIDVDLAYVVDYHGETDAATVREDSVEEGCLAATQVTREQQHRNVVFRHSVCVLLFRACKVTSFCRICALESV